MYISNCKPADGRTFRVFYRAGGNVESFHLLSTSLDVLVENEDAMMLYMSILWNKHDNIRWKDKRYNAALRWLEEKGIMHKTIAERYLKPMETV